MLNGLHLLIVALNQLSGECAQVTEQSSGTVVSAAGVAAGSWLSGLAFPALMPKSIYWTVATKQFNMRLCRYTRTDLVGVLTLLSWGWTSDGYVNGHQKASTMSAKVVAVRHIWWHTMQHCQRGDESIRET